MSDEATFFLALGLCLAAPGIVALLILGYAKLLSWCADQLPGVD